MILQKCTFCRCTVGWFVNTNKVNLILFFFFWFVLVCLFYRLQEKCVKISNYYACVYFLLYFYQLLLHVFEILLPCTNILRIVMLYPFNHYEMPLLSLVVSVLLEVYLIWNSYRYNSFIILSFVWYCFFISNLNLIFCIFIVKFVTYT